jgi:hypothetical protein
MRFWKLFSGIVLLSINVLGVLAQQDQSVFMHCLDASVQPVPLSEVGINGIIFVSSSDGIRAIRNSIPTSYVIAPSDHYRSFGTSGSFSPDGKWYVFSTGTSSQANWIDRHYHATRLNFINTHTGVRAFYVPIDTYSLFVGGSYPMRPEFAIRNWLSNVHYFFDENTVINVETQSQEPYTDAIPFQELAGGIISPDFTRMIIGERIVDIASGEILFETENPAQWLAGAAGYYVRSSEPDTIRIYDQNGDLRFSDGHRFATVSQTGKWLAWREDTESTDAVRRFFIMNTHDGQKVDLCTLATSIVFSPNDTQAAILTIPGNNRGQVWIIDLDTWEATPIDVYFHPNSVLVGWWGE